MHLLHRVHHGHPHDAPRELIDVAVPSPLHEGDRADTPYTPSPADSRSSSRAEQEMEVRLTTIHVGDSPHPPSELEEEAIRNSPPLKRLYLRTAACGRAILCPIRQITSSITVAVHDSLFPIKNRFIIYALLVCAYLLLSIIVVCPLLYFTPFGWQGSHATNLSPAAAAYAKHQWERYDRALAKDIPWLSKHPSPSLGAAKLASWTLSLPDVPNQDPNIQLIPSSPKIGGFSSDPSWSAPFNVDDVVVVTFASSPLYQRVLNLLGSIHFWEPTQRIVLYDLGLTQDQVLDLQCIKLLEVRPLNFTRLPDHVRNLDSFAFVPLILYDALEHDSSAIFIEAEYELRQPLQDLKFHLQHEGFFASGLDTTNHRSPLTQIPPHTLWELGIEPNVLQSLDSSRDSVRRSGSASKIAAVSGLCTGVLAFVRNSTAWLEVVQPAARCALKRACIRPKGVPASQREAPDRRVITLLLAKSGRQCNGANAIYALPAPECPLHHDRYIGALAGGVQFCLRGSFPPAYASSVEHDHTCVHFLCTSASGSKRDPQRRTEREYWMYVSPIIELSNHTLPSLTESSFACRSDHPCEEMQQPVRFPALQSNLAQVHLIIVTGLRMHRTYLVLAALWYAILRRVHGHKWIVWHVRSVFIAFLAIWTTVWFIVET